MLAEKKDKHRQQVLNTLYSSSKDPKVFWKTVKLITKKENMHNTITLDVWYNHFKNLFSPITSACAGTVEGKSDFEMDNCDTNICESLDCNITESEVYKALKNNKAPGPDGLINEFYKHSNSCVVSFLVTYFNKLFELGAYPDDWTESLIHPLHKKGDKNCPDNYRGISLLNVCSKIYSYILNKRLTAWAEENNVINEAQAGFRRNYSTIDHTFTLLALVQKQLLNHFKLYVAFIDFKKAFDLADRQYLWSVLKKNGLTGKMYRAIKSMYTVVKARVRAGSDLTDTLFCPLGVKQGEVTSPILFSFLINELANDIQTSGKHGIRLSPEDVSEILILLFADDVTLLSYSVIGLQKQLNILKDTANRLGLYVNFDKSKIVIFRNGGYISSKEKWSYDGQKLEIVNCYKYLGVIFSSGLTFSYALEDMALRARKAIFCILKLLWTIGDQSPSLFFKLFDCQVQPMLTYGAEVWGLMVDHKIIERIHTFAIKRLLNVSIKTPNALVYAETGRYPGHVHNHLHKMY